MAELTDFSNYNFLKGINDPLFEAILQAERMARIDYVDCGHKSRKACEIFINCVLNNKRLTETITGDLSSKISSLRNPAQLRQAGYQPPGHVLTKNAILPDLGTVDFLTNSGRESTSDYYDFIRKFGNECSHLEQKPHDPKVIFENVIKCLQGCHLLFSLYYAKQIRRNVGSFKENLMPIGQFYITESYTPSDKPRSKCNREYNGYLLNDRKTISYYAILRQYNKKDVDRNFLLRNSDVFLEASREAVTGIPQGMTSFRTIVGLNRRSSKFYITAHLFRYEPHPLSQRLLEGTSVKQRLELCAELASCFNNLHNADEPIYHRLLTYESIVVCIYKKRLIPYVVKFDYGKLTTPGSYSTVYIQAKQAEAEIFKNGSLTKYLAPEWESISNSKRANWEKIDIYSLGVLFSDILAGRFDSSLVTRNELRNLGLSDDLLEELDLMTSEKKSKRICTEEIHLFLKEELRKYR